MTFVGIGALLIICERWDASGSGVVIMVTRFRLLEPRHKTMGICVVVSASDSYGFSTITPL